jgi:hypothetical protein
MNKLISFAFLLFVSNFSFGQETSDTLFVNKAFDLDWCSQFKSNHDFQFIQLTNGIILKKGDTLKIGSPSLVNVSKSTIVQEKDDNTQIKSVTRNNFTYLALSTINYQLYPTGFKTVPESFKNDLFIIRHIWIKKGLLRKSYGTPILELKNIDTKAFNIIETRGVDKAFETRELINPKFLTKEEAILKLKEAKELVELGVITKEEYDQLRIKLSIFIKN